MDFTECMNKVYRVAENIGIGQYSTQPINSKDLICIEFLHKEKTCVTGDFFEFDFPPIAKE